MAERLTLSDLRRKAGIVRYGDAEIEVHALSPRDLLNLMERYDEFKKFLVGVSISFEEVQKSAPAIIAAIIVAGMRHSSAAKLSPEEAEAIASDLPAQLQVNLMITIWNMSFTEGFGPFVRTVRQIAEVAQIVSGKEQGTASPRPSKPMPSATETPSATRGKTSAPAPSPPIPSSPDDGASPKPATPSM